MGSEDVEGSGPSQQRTVIAKSWRRCRAIGLDRAAAPRSSPIGPAFFDYRRSHPMHDIQMLLEETIGDESVGSDSFVFITDERAGGLWTSDREGPRAQLTSHSLAVLLSEESAGTTAPALALLYRGEMQVDGPEHYLTALQNLWAAAAPVHDDATGRVIGVLRGGAAPVGRRHRRVGEACRDRRPLRRPDGRGDVRPDGPRAITRT